MAWIVLVAALAAGIVLTVAYRRRRPATARIDAATPRRRPAGRFQSVEIHVGARACADAQGLAGERFLAADAPSLPLAGCTAARCRCTYKKLSDRREEGRRWSDEGLGVMIFNAEERRSRGDRRGD
jgi:hypothetical protein